METSHLGSTDPRAAPRWTVLGRSLSSAEALKCDLWDYWLRLTNYQASPERDLAQPSAAALRQPEQEARLTAAPESA